MGGRFNIPCGVCDETQKLLKIVYFIYVCGLNMCEFSTIYCFKLGILIIHTYSRL